MKCVYCFQEIGNENICSNCGKSQQPPFENDKGQLPPGTKLRGGVYTLGKCLGQGGFGITYLAWNENFNCRCAIKEYFPSDFVSRSGNSVSILSESKKAGFNKGLNGFLQEARLLYGFRNQDNIVLVNDVFSDNDTAYYVMEYIEGQSLEGYLKSQGGRISIREAKKLLHPIFQALAAIHEKKTIHRDISPNNILLTKDKKPYLIDFGAARLDFSRDTGSLMILKKGFSPLEQVKAEGRSAQGPWTDIYALGATLYCAITGSVPVDSIERSVIDGALKLPSACGVDISPTEEKAVMKAMALKPENRYQTIAEFENDLYKEKNIPEKDDSMKKGIEYCKKWEEAERKKKEDEYCKKQEEEERKKKEENRQKLDLPSHLGKDIVLAFLMTFWILFLQVKYKILIFLAAFLVLSGVLCYVVEHYIPDLYQKIKFSEKTPSGPKPDCSCDFRVGPGEKIKSLSNLSDKLINCTGDVIVEVQGNIVEEKSWQLILPSGTELSSLTLRSSKGAIISGRRGAIYANGCTLNIDKGLHLPDTDIYAGGFAVPGREISLKNVQMDINGEVHNIYCGGSASGDTLSEVVSASLCFTGVANNIYAGGYAYNGGSVQLLQCSLNVAPDAEVKESIYFGGRANHNNSYAFTGPISGSIRGDTGKRVIECGKTEGRTSKSVVSSGTSVSIG